MKLTNVKLLATLAAGGLLAYGTAFAQTAASPGSPATGAGQQPGMGAGQQPGMGQQPTTGTGQQQPGMGQQRQMRGRMSIDSLETSLGLSDAQKTKVTPILTQERQQMTSVFQDTTLSRDDKIAKVRSIRQETETQLKSILTPDQFQQWQTMSQQRMRRPATPNTPTPSAPPTTPPSPPSTGP